MRLNECAGAPAHVSADPAQVLPDAGAIPDAVRYSRQVLFPGIGVPGQQRLAAAHVAIIGCGALGTASASLLARAGVGTLTLIDRDFVEPSNLQRQVLFDEADALESLPKAEAARRHIARFNSTITVRTHIADLTPANISDLLSGAAPASPSTDNRQPATGNQPPHILLDATDNFETRYLLNDYAVQHSIPWIYAAAIGAYAATMNILPLDLSSRSVAEGSAPTHNSQLTTHNCLPTACLACIFPKAPTGNVETCDIAGILSTAVNLAASIQVTEALKLLTGQPHLMRRTLIAFDLWSNARTGTLERSEIATGTPRPDCVVCGQRIFTHLSGADRPHITLCGRDSVQIHERHRPIDFSALSARLAAQPEIEALRCNGLLLRFRRGPHTLTLFADGRAIVQGTTDPSIARSLYARFIGT